MNKGATQDQINKAIWTAWNNLQGILNLSEHRNYIIVFLFLKYISDEWKGRYEDCRKKYGKDEEMIRRKMNRERFVLPDNCTFDYLYEHRNDADIGEKIDEVLSKIEDRNPDRLKGLFHTISFNSEKLGQTRDRNLRLKTLLSDFANPILDFNTSVSGIENNNAGKACTYLIEKFSIDSGSEIFYTPRTVSELLSKLVAPHQGARICDPTCGSGSLLITLADHVTDEKGRRSPDYALYGQEINGDTLVLAKLNMFLHGRDASNLAWGDTINNPMLLDGNKLMKFDIVVAHLPFSLDKWGAEGATKDRFRRFLRGVPPKGKGDYAFILHMLSTLLPMGKAAVIVPHGVLFRSGSEEKIRQALIEDNLLDAVIGLPANLFYGTGIPVSILIFSKVRKTSDVLFIDASHECLEGKKQNALRPQDIDKAVTAYQVYETIPKYAYRATLNELKENGFNLNIPRYVHVNEVETDLNIDAAKKEIEKLQDELAGVSKELNTYLEGLGLSDVGLKPAIIGTKITTG